jgi:hypothetical protein
VARGGRVTPRLLVLLAAAACGGGAAPAPAQSPRPAPAGAAPDTTGLPPAGLGTLRQDDLALRVQLQGLVVRAVPLEEALLRVLAPDSYRALRRIRDEAAPRVAAAQRRYGAPTVDLWYVSFFSAQQGDARYSPFEVVVRNVGRDFRPLDVLPLTPGFGDQRVTQRESQHAVYVFDGQLDPTQPLTMVIEGQEGGDWQGVLRRIERERAAIRARLPVTPKPAP